MKKKYVILSMLSVLTLSSTAKEIEVEPRVGICTTSPVKICPVLGGLVSVSLAERFYIQPGVLFSFVGANLNYNTLKTDIPVYASYRIPIRHVRLHLNAGPTLSIHKGAAVGVSAESGAEYKRFYAGLAYLQDFATGSDIFFNLSVGYKFRIR